MKTMSQKMKYPCRDSTDDMKQRSKYLILLITCCRCHTGTRDHPWTIRKMALQFAKWVGRDRCFSRKGCIGNAPGFKINIRGRPTGLFPKSQQLWCSSPQHPLPASSCSSQGIEELRPRPASIFLWSLPSYAFFCNVIEETLQLRSSSYHLFKQFSLYLHA
jgi:hypothetical protein